MDKGKVTYNRHGTLVLPAAIDSKSFRPLHNNLTFADGGQCFVSKHLEASTFCAGRSA